MALPVGMATPRKVPESAPRLTLAPSTQTLEVEEMAEAAVTVGATSVSMGMQTEGLKGIPRMETAEKMSMYWQR